MMQFSKAQVLKGTAVGTFGLSLVTNFYYLFARGVTHPDELFFAERTAFTANIFFLWLYWAGTYVLQAAYLHQLFVNDDDAARSGWTFVSFNTMNFVWLLLFGNKHYVLSEIVLVIGFINIMTMYFSLRTFAIEHLQNYAVIHLPTSALPLAWTFYALFWNGSVAFHAHSNLARILANLLIWAFFLVPGAHLLIFGDWGLGMAFAFISWGIGVGQFVEKMAGVQWILAFIIGAILSTLSTAIMLTNLRSQRAGHSQENVTLV